MGTKYTVESPPVGPASVPTGIVPPVPKSGKKKFPGIVSPTRVSRSKRAVARASGLGNPAAVMDVLLKAASVRTVETQVLTLRDAAALLRVSESGLTGDVEAGRLPGRRVAGEWRFSRTALLGWLSKPHAAIGTSPLVAPLGPWTPEAEAEIAEIYARRRALGGYE